SENVFGPRRQGESGLPGLQAVQDRNHVGCGVGDLAQAGLVHSSGAILTNLPALLSFRTAAAGKTSPFMTMNTPGGAVCAVANAIPRLNEASLSLNRAGASAPVMTIVLPLIDARRAADTVMVSVPWVITTREVLRPATR